MSHAKASGAWEMTALHRWLGACFAVFASMAMGWPACAQSSPPGNAHSKQSGGLRVPVHSVVKKGSSVIVQVLVENVASARQYVILYGSAHATLDTGETGRLKAVRGVNTCQINRLSDVKGLENCRKMVGTRLDYFTYIEPGDSLVVTMEYLFGARLASVDPQSMNFAMLGLVRVQTDPLSQQPAGPVQQVTINYPLTAIDKD